VLDFTLAEFASKDFIRDAAAVVIGRLSTWDAESRKGQHKLWRCRYDEIK